MLDYQVIKLVHQAAVALSVTGFVARGVGIGAGAAWARSRPAKTLPHVVDTVLLLSAVMLAWSLRLDPLHAPWLMAKILGLVLYVALGVLALRPGRTRTVRMSAWVSAVVVVGWIASVAMTKSPWGFLAAFA